MRVRLQVLVLVAAGFLELAAPPVNAQLVSRSDTTIVQSGPAARRKAYARRAISWSVFGAAAVVVAIIMVLNTMDRRAAKRAVAKQQLERLGRGLM